MRLFGWGQAHSYSLYDSVLLNDGYSLLLAPLLVSGAKCLSKTNYKMKDVLCFTVLFHPHWQGVGDNGSRRQRDCLQQKLYLSSSLLLPALM